MAVLSATGAGAREAIVSAGTEVLAPQTSSHSVFISRPSSFIHPMFVIQLLLPLTANDGGRFPQAHFAEVRTRLTTRFGGVTAYSRAPAEGTWVSNDTG